MCRFLIAFALILISSLCAGTIAQAQEGDRVRNGGFVIRCEQSQLSSSQVMVLDHYEALNKYGKKVTPSADKLPWNLLIDSYLRRIKKYNPTRFDLYSRWLEDFDRESLILKNQHLQIPPDYDFGVVPAAGCRLEVAVMQVRPKPGESIRYYIDGIIWAELSELEKAILVFHELTYREALLPENAQTTSLLTRFYVGQVIADDFAELGLADYLKVVKGAGLQAADAHGVRIALHALKEDGSKLSLPLYFFDKNTVQMAVPAATFNFGFYLGEKKDYAQQFCNPSALLSDRQRVLFYPNGAIRRVTVSANPNDCNLFSVNFFNSSDDYGAFSGSEVNFAPDGKITELGQWQNLKLPYSGFVAQLPNFSASMAYFGEDSHFQVRFYPSGKIRSIFLGFNDQNLRLSSVRTESSGEMVSLYSLNKNFVAFSDAGKVEVLDFKYLDDSVRE